MRLLALFIPMLALAAADPAAKSERLPVPDAAAQLKAEKTIKDVFKAEYAKKKIADQVDLASTLLKQADETSDDPVSRFVLLRESRDLAAKAGDAALAVKAVDELTRLYDLPAVKSRLETLELLDKSISTVAASKPVFELAMPAAEEAIVADDYESALRFLRVAQSAAGKSKVAASIAASNARVKDVEKLKVEFEKTKTDRDTLKINPDDAAAAERVGRFLCLFKGDWNTGLPLLAKAKDTKLAVLAMKDLENPEKAAARIELADAWYDFAATLDKASQSEAQLRAERWYKEALAELSGLTKTRVEKRIDEIEKLTQRNSTSTPSGWTVIFRSSDPSIWNTDVRKNANHLATKLDKAPDKTRYLRLTDCANSAYVIVEMIKDNIGKRIEENGYGWNGTAVLDWKGYHLGVYDVNMTAATPGDICIHVPGILQGLRGWGFGNRFRIDDRTGHSWAGKAITPVVFEIAVKTTELTPEEARHLLKKKGK
jgi:hypothetical protein